MAKYKSFKYKRRHRRHSIMSTNAGPILMLLAFILAILLAIGAIVFFLLPWLLPLIGVDYRAPFTPTPTPVVTPAPTPTPHRIINIDPAILQKEIMPAGGQNSPINTYPWFGNDPYAYGDKVIFTLGRLEGNNPCLSQLYEYSLSAGTYKSVEAQLTNDSYFYPVFNEKWLCYLDAKVDGGGVIRVQKLDSGENFTLKEYYAGVPKLNLDGDTLVWTERTGSRMDKLFAADLNTLETVTVEMFENSQYGISKSAVSQNEIIWANLDPSQSAEAAINAPISAIYLLKWGESKPSVFIPGVYVHDPLTNGKQWVWIDSNHAPEANLYVWTGSGVPEILEKEVTGYGISESFVAYSKHEQLWIYFFDLGSRHQITPENEKVQFLNVSKNVVFWMDVTTRERDSLKYAVIED